MRKIALFSDPLPHQGKWRNPPEKRTDEKTGTKYVVGTYQDSFTTAAGQTVEFGATVNYEQTWADEGSTIIILDFTVGGMHTITGKGEAFQIFATVIDITLDVYDKVRAMVPQGVIFIMFEAQQTSRAKLYDRLAQELAKVRDGEISRGGDRAVRFDPPPVTSWGG